MNFVGKYVNGNIVFEKEVGCSCYDILVIDFLNDIICRFDSCREIYFKFFCKLFFILVFGNMCRMIS